MKSLNIGCGESMLCTDRLDITRDSNANVIGLATMLPYKDDSFDYILAENVLEHQANPLNFLNECKRVLNETGTLFIVTDNYGYRGWFRILNRFYDSHGLYSNPKSKLDKHYMIFSIHHLENLFHAANMKVVSSELFTRWKPSLIQRLWTLISPKLGHSHIMMAAFK